VKFVTYAGMKIDRLSSAWLIRRFIDPKAEFRFIARGAASPKGWTPFDMPDVEFSHHGDNCTFETLVRKHKIRDRGAREIAEIVHDADVKDGKFGRVEAPGVLMAVRAIGAASKNDQEMLKKGLPLFDGLRRILGEAEVEGRGRTCRSRKRQSKPRRA
jgi:hypothetical protein